MAQRIVIRGEARRPLSDIYHAFLTKPWRWVLLTIAVGFLAMNVVFAFAYGVTGGVANADGFLDDFFFAVQTAGTIGYGAMYPVSRAANTLVVAESVLSLIVTALATGLIFSKFSRSTARMRFSKFACITKINGVSTLALRMGNQRGNAIVEATIHVTLSRTEITDEGEKMYRSYDLPLVRERATALSRSWTAMHPITEWSMLKDATPESLAASEAEVLISVTGIDETSMQNVHARKIYDHAEIKWGMRHADLLTDTPEEFVVDLTRFDDVVPS
ncbi:MAG TPA: ion channel [Kofleriaceae bacterium]|nr:ion channel [Kofleriaceae bacterium]